MTNIPVNETWLSIVIPTYNRRGIVRRAIDSCFRDSVPGYEVIVVDDGSTDGTSEILRQYRTERLRTIRLDRNGGVSEARMAGVETARGKWVLFLDSDDELTLAGLSILHAGCQDAASDIGRLAYMYVHDDGKVSPQPWTPGVIMDYRMYLEWSERVADSDLGNCIRRSTFAAIQFPRGRAYESIYHLDFAKAFKTLCCGDVIIRMHADAHDRLTKTSVDSLYHRLLDEAEARMQSMHDVMVRHGEALRRHAPKRAQMFSRALISGALMAGHRRIALRGFLDHLRRHPRSYNVWGVTAVGLLSRRALAWAIAMRHDT